MAGAHLTLFGKFDIRRADGSLLDLPGQKDRALLAILALSSGAALSRDKLTGLLWSNRADTQARDSLKHALKHIRQVLSDAVPEEAREGLVTTDRHEVRLAPDWISVDVVAFEALIRKGTPEALKEANRLCAGELLEGIAVHDVGFESWLLAERQRLGRLQEQAHAKLLAPALDTEIRERAALKLLELDPTREAAVRALMQIHVERGESAQAVKLFETLRERLQIDLGVKPEQETLETYESIRSGRLRAPGTQPTLRWKPEQTAPVAGGPHLIGKPWIAVLPFENMSGDPEQNYFADGIAEDIITEVSRFRELQVIARNSSFAFRGQNIEIAEITRKLGVQFVVEGSVRKAGNRLRISAQLIEAESYRHVWAERYDRDLDDVFLIQDDIARTVASIVAGHVKTAGAARTRARPTESLSAYDLFLRARALYRQYGSYEERVTLLARALELDPDYAMAHAFMANTLMTLSFYDGDVTLRERAAAHARRAISLDPAEPWGHGMLGWCLTFLGRAPEAGMHFDRARQLNPNDGLIAVLNASWHCFVGHVEHAIANIEEALKRDPFGPEWYWDDYCTVLVVAQRYEEAIAAYDKMMAPAPWSHLYAAIAEVNLGKLDRARILVSSFLKTNPAITPEQQILMEPYVDRGITDRLIADLRKIL